jgi:hypothetical protein
VVSNNTTAPTTFNNSILWANTGSEGSQIYNFNSADGVMVNDSILEGGCAQDITCFAVFDLNPWLGPLANYGGFSQTLPLQANSPAIDSANNTNCPVTDQRGMPRPADGDGDGVSDCDMGAYEYVFTDLIFMAGFD